MNDVTDFVTRTAPDGTTYRMRVSYDTTGDYDSPRDFEGNLGVMVLAHRRYDLASEGELAARIDEVMGDSTYGASVQERLVTLAGWLRVEHGARVVLPVWGYDHSGLSLKAGSRTYPFSDPWDSGLAGVIYDDATVRDREFGQLTDEAIVEILTDEVRRYGHYVNGHVYRWDLEELVKGKDGQPDRWDHVVGGTVFGDEDEATVEGMSALEEYAPSLDGTPRPALPAGTDTGTDTDAGPGTVIDIT